jgi:hypothetical protein
MFLVVLIKYMLHLLGMGILLLQLICLAKYWQLAVGEVGGTTVQVVEEAVKFCIIPTEV